MKSSTNKKNKDWKKRFIVYEMREYLVCEGTYDDICKYIDCDVSTIHRAFRSNSKCAVVKGYHIYKENLGEENEFN